EGRSASDRALNVDLSAVPRDNLMRNGQSESGAGRLRGEERLEDLMQHLLGNPFAGIGDRDVDERFGMRDDREGERRSGARTPGANGERAALRHGVAGVRNEIHEDLRELRRVGEDLQALGWKVADDSDVVR